MVVSLSLFLFFFLYARPLWTELGHWYDLIIAAIAFLYSTVMIHMLLIKRRDQKKRQELEACEVIIIIKSTYYVRTDQRMSLN